MVFPRLVAIALVIVAGMLFSGCQFEPPEEPEAAMTFTITTTAFEPGKPIPKKYTEDGDDLSPALSWSDPVIFSSLTESRFLAGSLNVFKRFFRSLRHGAIRRGDRLVKDVYKARQEERNRWGETNFLLTPNVKKSRGGLRDIQMIRWIGFARYGEVDLEQLLKLDALSIEDYRMIRRAYDFLIRLPRVCFEKASVLLKNFLRQNSHSPM